MQLNEFISVRGCITQDKYLKGKSLAELENILGFHKDRLKAGVVIAALMQIPAKNQFELLGYTQVAGHKINDASFRGLDVDKLKEMVVRDTFTTVGVNRLVKVLPDTPHSEFMDNDEQYPPGWGVPQWKLTHKLNAEVVAIIKEGERYV